MLTTVSYTVDGEGRIVETPSLSATSTATVLRFSPGIATCAVTDARGLAEGEKVRIADAAIVK